MVHYRADNRTLASLRHHSGTARLFLPYFLPYFLASFLIHIPLLFPSTRLLTLLIFLLFFVLSHFISSIVYSHWTFFPRQLFSDSLSVILWAPSVHLSVCLSPAFRALLYCFLYLLPEQHSVYCWSAGAVKMWFQCRNTEFVQLRTTVPLISLSGRCELLMWSGVLFGRFGSLHTEPTFRIESSEWQLVIGLQPLTLSSPGKRDHMH